MDNLSIFIIRNSAIADKPCDAFVEYAMARVKRTCYHSDFGRTGIGISSGYQNRGALGHGQTDTGRTAIVPRLRIASRGKNCT